MSSPMTKDQIVTLISEIINDPLWNEKSLNDISEQDEQVLTLCRQLVHLRNFSQALAQGDLFYKSDEKGVAVGMLKQFQANLRHLVWQMNELAQGDFSQNVQYMGDFSTAFNSLREALAAKVDSMNELFNRYKKSSETDLLTGLPNRRAFIQRSHQLIKHVASFGNPISLIIADIDHFKSINDTFGHNIGDSILKQIAQCLRKQLRSNDLCCRWGGEEFLFLLCGAPLNVAQLRAENLRTQCANSVFDDLPPKTSITISLGIASFFPKAIEDSAITKTLEKVISQADQNLYHAKNNGRNQIFPPLTK